jgi:DNA/RNA endonuclease YhcR with UshA esterase domain
MSLQRFLKTSFILLMLLVHAFTARSQQKLIYYWHFNNLNTGLSAAGSPSLIGSIHANYGTLDSTKATISDVQAYTLSSTYKTYWDAVAGDASDTFNVKWGPKGSAPGSNALRVRNPNDSMMLIFKLPVTSYKNISINFSTERSSTTSGPAKQSFDYSTDGGLNWKTSGLSATSDSFNNAVWNYVSVSLASDINVNNNANFWFRIKLGKPNTGTSGNSRFDNISVEGDTIVSAVSLSKMESPYTQDFDSLVITGTSSALPYGWAIYETGTNANATYAADSGSSSSGNTYSYGHKNNTNRALGSLASGSLIPNYGVTARNNTGRVINSLRIKYTVEQWRLGTATRGFPDSVHAYISTDATNLGSGTWTELKSLTFTSPVVSGTAGIMDGNNSANQSKVNATLTGFSLNPGKLFWLKWSDPNVLSNDDGLAIDNFSMTVPFSPFYKIREIRTQNAAGVADSVNKGKGFLKGVVMSPSYSKTYLQFSLADSTGAITIFTSSVKNYTPKVGDSIIVRGYVTQFNGITEYTTDSIIPLTSGSWLETPSVLTTMDESHESHLIKINNVHLLTPSQWTGSGSGFNVDISNGKDTFSMRITNAVDLFSMSAPGGNFNVTGIETQFKSSSPYIGGYQIEPRGYSDIELIRFNPLYKIRQLKGQNAAGVADSVNKGKGYIKGVVHSPSFSATSLQFTIIDSTGAITIFTSKIKYYSPSIGDSLLVKGTLTQFNGVTEYTADTIVKLTAGTWLKAPTVVTKMDESHESDLIKIKNVHLIDTTQWVATGSGFNVTIVDDLKDTFVMRVTAPVDLFKQKVIKGNFNVTGIETQFKSASPFIGGYQIEPRGISDIEIVLPPSFGIPLYNIRQLKGQNAAGVADSVNKGKGYIKGVVYSPSFSATSSQFTIIDSTGAITVFTSKIKYYTPSIGDSLLVKGTLTQFNGVTEYTADTIVKLTGGSWLKSPSVVTTMDESRESDLIKILNVHIIDSTQWTSAGSGFNVTIVDNVKDTFVMRITSATDLFKQKVIKGNFNVTGIETQFKSASPFIGGYQIEPRGSADIQLLASAKPTPLYKIRQVRGQNAITGVADSAQSKNKFFVKGIVQSPSYSNTGDNFSLKDSTGSINIFASTRLNGYTPKTGDSIQVRGLLAQFNGLTEVAADSVSKLSGSNPVLTPKTISKMDETTESWLVKFNNAYIINPAQWTGTGSGFNVDITNGKDTMQMRVTNAVDLYTRPAPKGRFNVTGIVGQFKSASPYIGGYQLQPRGLFDIQPVPLKLYTISQVKGFNSTSGVADSINVYCMLKGVVHSGNLTTGPSQFFSLKDNTGVITIIAPVAVNGYSPAVGDSIQVRGSVAQNNGLTLFIIDSVSKKTAGTAQSPVLVTKLDETTESDLVMLQGYKLVDLTKWDTTGAGGLMLVKAWKASADTITLAIMKGTGLYLNSVKPGSYFDITGIGSQIDPSKPFLQNYVIIPRTISDIAHSTGVEPTVPDNRIFIYPNPSTGVFNVKTEETVEELTVTDLSGKVVAHVSRPGSAFQVDLGNAEAGIYFITINFGTTCSVSKIVKK